MLLHTLVKGTTPTIRIRLQFKTFSLGESTEKVYKYKNFLTAPISLSLCSTHEGNMRGVRYITQKALHGMSAQRTVSIQEAVFMVDNQDLVICSEKFTYLSLRQGAMLTSKQDS